MNKRWMWIGGAAALLVVVIAFTLYLVSPLLQGRTAQQDLPLAAPTIAGATMTQPLEEQEATTKPTTPTGENAEPTTEATTAAAATAGKTVQQETPTSDSPVALNSANFVDVGSSYQGSGTATIYQLADGRRLLRFEEFMVTPGPELKVLLATNPAPTNRDELGEYVDLGPLEATSGDQEYEIPDDVDLEAYRSVVIYCVPFHVVFTTAYFIP